MRVNGGAYGQRPKLTPEALHRQARPAVRVLQAGAFKKAEGSRQRFVYWISIEEPPDHILFLNGSDLRELVAALGDDTEGWVGRTVVLELVRRQYDGRPYEKYAVAPADEWDEVLSPPKPQPPKPRTKKARKGSRAE